MRRLDRAPLACVFGPLLALAPLLACSSSPNGASPSGAAGNSGASGAAGAASAAANVPCDPLAPKPITLGFIVGIAKDAAGTIYVDAANGVFASDGSNKLIRQHVIGTGQSGASELLFTFLAPFADPASARNLLVETQGQTARAMALGPTSSKAFLDQNPPGTTPLTLADGSSISGMTLVNTPSVISYVGLVDNTYVLLATVPMNEDSSAANGGLAIFYGPAAAVPQRVITAFEQSRSGTGTLTFLVDGAPNVLAFGNLPAPGAGPFGVFTLESVTPQGGAPIGIHTAMPTPTVPPPATSYTCLP